jgi:ubiquinone/menaquinone biosynthesis C-methylase UbiE
VYNLTGDLCSSYLKQLRKKIFAEKNPFDNELVSILDPLDKEFDFLRNPVVQNIYIYQIKYIKEFSRIWFENEPFNVLDWGSGKGHVSYWMKKNNINVTSCDVSNTGVTSAFIIKSPIYSYANIEAVELKHEYILPFNDSSFDVVISSGVLEHVANDFESLKEINRILKKDGLFFCFHLPYKYSYTQNIQHFKGNWYHDKLYSKKEVKCLLEKTNYKLLDIWHRALFPKRSFVPPCYSSIEKIDNWLCNYTILKYFATNIEFVVYKY